LFMGIVTGIEEWDRSLFNKLNSEWTNPFFDQLMPFLRTSNHWLPLYLFLLVFATLNFKGKGFWWFVIFICTIALTDMMGTHIFKHNVERLRPCNDPEMMLNLRLLVENCSGGHQSFISNHAANHFGMATFFYLTFRKVIPKWAWIGFPWAFMVAYSQIYVGVHYPLDVIAGAILGLCVGNLTSYIFNKRFGFTTFDNQPTAIT